MNRKPAPPPEPTQVFEVSGVTLRDLAALLGGHSYSERLATSSYPSNSSSSLSSQEKQLKTETEAGLERLHVVFLLRFVIFEVPAFFNEVSSLNYLLSLVYIKAKKKKTFFKLSILMQLLCITGLQVLKL